MLMSNAAAVRHPGRPRPTTYGRFLEPDPIGYGDGLNMYAYVKNDPVNFVDPTGTECRYIELPSPSFLTDSNGRVHRGTYQTLICMKPVDGGEGRDGGRSSPGVGNPAPAQPPQNGEPSTLENVWACTKEQYGFGEDDGLRDAAAGVGRGTSEALAIPVPKEAFGMRRHPGTSSTTNVLNAISHKTRVGAGVNIPGQYGRMAGQVFGSARLLTVLGRANMVIGTLFALYDAGSIAYCTYKKGQ